jgi:hypothetical protein
MKQVLFVGMVLLTLFSTACQTLTSVTTIKAKDSFVLGNNEHAAYSVRLKNISSHDIRIVMAPIGGGSYSPQVVRPNQTVNVEVRKNTALVVENASAEEVSVALKVSGDTNLSMGYKN